jgi:hypothetical protein
MIQLINKVQGQIYTVFTGNIDNLYSISGEIQQEDFIDLNGFVAYLQNFTRVYSLENLQNPINFGLKNSYNIPMVTLEINY